MGWDQTGGGGGSGLLAKTAYAPDPYVQYSKSDSTFADVDATNLTVTFIAPSSGAVIVVLSAWVTTEGDRWMAFNLRDAAGNVAQTQLRASHDTAERATARIPVSGLVAGQSYTWKWGWSRFTGTGIISIYAGIVDATDSIGPAMMEVWAE